jgi:membrane fusion protein, multidrug efflux system
MKKTLAAMIAVFCFLGAGFWFYSPLRNALRPFMPVALQQFLPAAPGGDPAKDAGANIHGSKSGGGPIAVAVVAAETANLPLIEHTYGVVKSPTVATVNARVASQIIEIHVKEGQMVKAGDLLVSLDDSLLQAQLEKDQAVLLKDQAQLASATADLARAQDLAKKGAGTQQAADQALAAQKSALANENADKATIDSDNAQLAFTKIIAPVAGRLGAIQAVVGNLVTTASAGSASNNLMTITQLQPLKVSFQLPERTLTDIQTNLTAGIQLPVHVFRSGTTTELENGNLDFIDSAVDTTSGTINMSATVDNDKLALWPGQFVDVEVTKGQLANAVVVPTVAIQQSQTGPFVWVMKDDDTVALTPVTVAQSEGDKSAIASGVAAGDKVVVEGQLKLKDGAAVKLGGKPADAAAGGAEASTDAAAPADGKKKHQKKTP